MSVLTAAELTKIRDFQESTMTDTCTIKRPATTSDGAGGTVTTPLSTVAADVACRVMFKRWRPEERDQAFHLIQVAAFEVILPVGTDVTHRDIIVTTETAQTLEVMYVLQRTNLAELRVFCREIV